MVVFVTLCNILVSVAIVSLLMISCSSKRSSTLALTMEKTGFANEAFEPIREVVQHHSKTIAITSRALSVDDRDPVYE